MGFSSFLSFSLASLNFDKSILKQFFISRLDFLEIVELLRLCSFYFFAIIYLLSRVLFWIWALPETGTPLELLILIFLYISIFTWNDGQKAVDSVDFVEECEWGLL